MSEEQKEYAIEYIMQLQEENYKLGQENKQLKEEIEEYKRIEQEDLEAFNNYDSILTELEEWLKENIKLKPLQTTYFFEIDHKQKSISEIELNELKRVLDKIQELKEKYK